MNLYFRRFDVVQSSQCTDDFLQIVRGEPQLDGTDTLPAPGVGKTDILENYNMAALGFQELVPVNETKGVLGRYSEFQYYKYPFFRTQFCYSFIHKFLLDQWPRSLCGSFLSKKYLC